MKTVWKYKLEAIGETVITLPIPHRILGVQLQFGVPHIWIERDNHENSERCKATFVLIPTGGEVPEHGYWCGSLYSSNAEFVFHVYRKVAAVV